ncbi:RNA demethylase ALKBH10B-like [Zingiber officinale]|uniref:RNA demethylase ALKBH10B-like n=1 Tax=Zingiber officinale TaxID=94328 RepID=UPI001C4AAB16|nr:RNA demethylase ALKBH10B-like [Zingiber officinale]XP_042390952.1 RNA demethylase ALKBH10B-like [Zingiber officinale]
MAAVVAGAGTSAAVPELYARDAMIAWFRSEFAAANAIIDALCSHLAQIGGAEEYESVFAAVHRRRLNWIPVLHMQKFYSISDISAELHSVAANRSPAKDKFHAVFRPEEKPKAIDIPPAKEEIAAAEEAVAEGVEIGVKDAAAAEIPSDEAAYGSIEGAGIEEQAVAATEVYSGGDASDHKAVEDGDADKGSQEELGSVAEVNVCTERGDCLVPRPERIKISKGFVAKEAVKGHMANVVKGLKLYENIFSESELPSLVEYINELRLAGRRGELPGETYIFFNKQIKGNKREIIQLGVPLFQSATEEGASNIESIPSALQTVINHLVQWRLVPESKKPNSCIINFFDEDEHSQPYFKPPHLENPISTLLLSETTMAFGRSLISDHEGNYKGSLTLTVKEGSLLVMRGNSADMARHVVCASPSKRMTITFVKVRTFTLHSDSPTAIQSNKAMTLWQSGNPTSPQKVPNGGIIAYGPPAMIPATWGLTLRTPVVMLAPPPRAVVMNPIKKVSRNGTGVFLPWAIGPKKYTKHLPPRIQKRRLLALPSPLEAQA